MGYQRRVLEDGLCRGIGMELCICPTTTCGRAGTIGGPHIPPNGLGGVTTVFLYSEARDVTTDYINQSVGALQKHKFERYVIGDAEYNALPESCSSSNGFLYTIEVYMDDFMSLVIPVSREQLRNVATVVMTGIRDVFPPAQDDSNDPISEKKLRQQEGQFSTRKTLLGFDFDGIMKTMWLEEAKREKLLTVLRGWIRAGHRGTSGIPFNKFESITAKL